MKTTNFACKVHLPTYPRVSLTSVNEVIVPFPFKGVDSVCDSFCGKCLLTFCTFCKGRFFYLLRKTTMDILKIILHWRFFFGKRIFVSDKTVLSDTNI